MLLKRRVARKQLYLEETPFTTEFPSIRKSPFGNVEPAQAHVSSAAVLSIPDAQAEHPVHGALGLCRLPIPAG